MAEFGVKATELSGPSAAGSTPLQPVQQPVKQYDGNWLAGITPLVSALQTNKKTRLEEATDAYATGLDKISQLSLTGDYNAKDVDRERRRLWSQVQSQYSDVPKAEMQQAFNRQFDAAKEASGLTQEIEEAKQQRSRDNDIINEGTKMGLWTSDFANNPGTREMALNMMQTVYDDQRRLKMAGEAYDRTRKMVENGREDVKFQQDQEQKALQKQAQDFVRNSITNYSDVATAMMNDLVGQVKANKIKGEEGIASFTEKINAFRAQATASTMQDTAAQGRINQFLDSLIDNAKYQMDPKNITEFDEQRNKLVITKNTAALLSEYPMAVAISSLRGVMGDTAITGVGSLQLQNEVLQNFMEVGATGKSTIVQKNNREQQKITYKAIDQAAAGLQAGTSKDVVADTNNVEANTKAILSDLGRIRSNDNVKLTETVNFLAGPTVKYLIEKGRLTPEDLADAGSVYQSLYRNELLSSVSQTMSAVIDKPGRGGRTDSAALNSLIDFTVDDNGTVRIVPKWTTKDFNNSTASEMRAYQEINELNRKIGGVSTAIRMGAHMAGRTDYKKFYEENADILLPNFMPDQKILDAGKAKGYKYIGGNYRNPSNWERVGGKSD